MTSIKENLGVIDPGKFANTLVIMGGLSAEREVSLNSGKAVVSALKTAGVDAQSLVVSEDVVAQLERIKPSYVFNILHGRGGEDGKIQGVLETMGIPYTGSDVLASALSMDKHRTKHLWRSTGLPTAKFTILKETSNWQEIADNLGLPLMVKPAREGSSFGMSKARTVAELKESYTQAAKYDDDVIAEAWLTGAEYTVAYLKGQALPVIRLETDNEFYDYEAKYVSNDTRYIIPCGLPQQREREMQQLAVKAMESVGCYGWGRVDVMEDANGEFNLLEVNTVPGMTDHSLVPMAAKAVGLSFEELVLQILSTATEKK